jgi:hypothetical protein
MAAASRCRVATPSTTGITERFARRESYAFRYRRHTSQA